MAKEEKVLKVSEIKDKLERSQTTVLADYRGLTVKEATALRATLRQQGIEYRVLKNTLTEIAAKELGIEGLESHLAGPTAIAFGYEDPVTVAKLISDFAKGSKKFKIKCAILEGKVVDSDAVKALADLPSREVLLSRVLGGMQAPLAGFVGVLQGTLRKFVYALDAVRKQKEETA